MELINALGIDIKILVAQLINFGILLFVLMWFFYKPILRMLDERSKKIERGVLDAEKAKERLVEIEEKERKIISEAQKKANGIVAEAYEKLEVQKAQMAEKTREEVLRIKEEGVESLENHKRQVMREIKTEAGELVVLATKKTMDIKTSVDKKIVDKVLEEI